jgi:hypothetical protein
LATSTLTPANICSMALRMLGDDSITTAELAAATIRRAAIAAEFYATVRDATLAEHPWNCATKRATLLAYTLPAATLTPGAGATVVDTTGVTFTASAAVFVSTDVGKQLVNRESGGSGKATITGFTSTTVVTATIDEAFDNLTAIASQSWRMYYAYPAWGPSRAIAVPTDCLRVWRLESNEEYQVEGGYIVLSQDSLNCRYTRQETDTTLYPFQLVLAMATHLASVFAEPITGQAAKAEHFTKLYEHRLARAKALDGQEGTPETLESNALIDVR